MSIQQQVTEFPALGTTIRGAIVGDETQSTEAFRRVRGYIFDFEQRFSRFIVGNELDRLNRSAGHLSTISPEMLDLLLAAKQAYELSDGLVDITVGQAMQDIGYSTSFELLPKTGMNLPTKNKASAPTVAHFSDLQLDPKNRTIRLPLQTRLDFGGIGKGYLLDQCEKILHVVSGNYWLSLGGDLILSGHDRYGRPWPVGVQDPFALDTDKKTITMPVGRYAIGASGTTKRQWVTTSGKRHHIIDPRTGTSTTTDVAMAMAVTTSGLAADVLAKTAVILGSEPALAMFNRHPRTYGVVITVDGRLHPTPSIANYIA